MRLPYEGGLGACLPTTFFRIYDLRHFWCILRQKRSFLLLKLVKCTTNDIGSSYKQVFIQTTTVSAEWKYHPKRGRANPPLQMQPWLQLFQPQNSVCPVSSVLKPPLTFHIHTLSNKQAFFTSNAMFHSDIFSSLGIQSRTHTLSWVEDVLD